MRARTLWIEIVALGSMIACGLALLIATLGAGAVALGGQAAAGQSSDPSSSSQGPSSQGSSRPASSSASLAVTSTPPRLQTREGMVTDSRCGAKHSADMGQTAGDCARHCVHAGATFALVDGDKTYQLDGDATVLKSVAGQRARVRGVVSGNSIKVSSVAAGS